MPSLLPGMAMPGASYGINTVSDAGSGGPSNYSATRAGAKMGMLWDSHSRNQVMALQRFLRNRGYNIAIDGQRGPQTNAAVNAFHMGVPAKAWNAKSAHASAKKVVAGRAVVPTRAAGPNRAPVVSKRRIVKPIKVGNRTITPAPVSPGEVPVASTSAGGYDSAEALVDAQYGPQLAALQRAQQQAAAQAASNLQQLGQWYKGAEGSAVAAGQSNQQGNAALLAGEDQSNQNLLQLFGGPGANGPAGEAGAFADINRTELTGLSSAQQAFDTNMVPIIHTQGAEAAQSVAAAGQAQASDIAAQIADMQRQRGAALVQAKYQQQQDEYQRSQDATKQAMAEQEFELAKQLAGPKVASAKANAALATMKAKSYPAQLMLQAKKFGLSTTQAKANINATNQRIKLAQQQFSAKQKAGQFDLTDPRDRGDLATSLSKIVQGKQGGFRMHPAMAYQSMSYALKQLGLQNDKNAVQMANNIILETLNNSHGLGNWGDFGIVKGQVVRVKKAKPKKK